MCPLLVNKCPLLVVAVVDGSSQHEPQRDRVTGRRPARYVAPRRADRLAPAVVTRGRVDVDDQELVRLARSGRLQQIVDALWLGRLTGGRCGVVVKRLEVIERTGVVGMKQPAEQPPARPDGKVHVNLQTNVNISVNIIIIIIIISS